MKNKMFILVFNYISLVLMCFIYGYMDNELKLSVLYFSLYTFFFIIGIKNIIDNTRTEMIEVYNKVLSGATVLLFVDGIFRIVNGRPIGDDLGDILFALYMIYAVGVYFYYIYWKPYYNFHKK